MGWVSAMIERRTPRFWAILAVFGAIVTATVLLIGVQAAFGLAGSKFEIDPNANTKVDTAGIRTGIT